MEFNEKLQQLRKEKKLTQEQLAEQLYVSRTAVSKWESGKGYPNIESLKSISKLYGVSIDDLLSGEELIDLAKSENRSNVTKVTGLMVALLDILAVGFIFLPLYGIKDGEVYRSVSLIQYNDSVLFVRVIYFVSLVLMILLGMAELLILHWNKERYFKISRILSIVLQVFTIFFFTASNQPYACSLMFLLFIMKGILLFKSRAGEI